MSRHSFHENIDNLVDNIADNFASDTTPMTLSPTGDKVNENLVEIDEIKVDSEETTEVVIVVDNTDATNNNNLDNHDL